MRKKRTKEKKRRRRRRSRLLLLLLPPSRELGFFESLFLPPRLDSPAISLRSLKSAGPVEAERAPPPPRPPFKVPPSTESCAAASTPPPPPPRGIWLVATSGLAAAAVAEEAWEASWKVGGDPRRGIFLVFHSFSQNFPSFFLMNCGPRRLPKNLVFQKSNQLSFFSSPLSLLLSSRSPLISLSLSTSAHRLLSLLLRVPPLIKSERRARSPNAANDRRRRRLLVPPTFDLLTSIPRPPALPLPDL